MTLRPTLQVDPAAFDRDPYAVYAAARAFGSPVWLEPQGYWLEVDHARVQALLADAEGFTTVSARSPILRTFGANMLASDGSAHLRRRAPFRPTFTPAAVKRDWSREVSALVDGLLASHRGARELEVRAALAARLPIQTILRVFGLPLEHEGALRTMFDAFEHALADFGDDPEVRAAGRRAFGDFTALLARAGGEGGVPPAGSDPPSGLSPAAAPGDAAIVFFGAISTVEALLLNMLWTLGRHPDEWERLRADRDRLPAVLEETMRWQSPVQSATRYAVADRDVGAVRIAAGEMLSLSLAGANRDPAVHADPDRFDPDRSNLRHLGFAAGPHFCLGSHLARLEVATAMKGLLDSFEAVAVDQTRTPDPTGSEFRQPTAVWLK